MVMESAIPLVLPAADGRGIASGLHISLFLISQCKLEDCRDRVRSLSFSSHIHGQSSQVWPSRMRRENGHSEW